MATQVANRELYRRANNRYNPFRRIRFRRRYSLPVVVSEPVRSYDELITVHSVFGCPQSPGRGHIDFPQNYFCRYRIKFYGTTTLDSQ